MNNTDSPFMAEMKKRATAEAESVPPFARDLEQDFEEEPEEFPISYLPPVLGEMAMAISASIKVPRELSGPLVLGIVSGALGKGLQLASGAERMIRGNLYLLGIAESGTGKSSACKLAAAPIQSAESKALGFWKEITKPEIKAELRVLEREIKNIETQLTGKKNFLVDRSKLKKELTEKIANQERLQEELEPPRTIVEDVTQESLGSLLARNNEQLFSLSADAGKTLQNLEGRYIKDKGKSDDGLYVQAYTGDMAKVDRIGREPVILDNPCLALLWLMQPERAQHLISNQDLRTGGFLPRCLLWNSFTEPVEQDEEEKPIPQEVRARYTELIEALLETYREDKVHIIPTSTLAKEAIRQYHNRLVPRRRKEWRDIGSFVARWHEHAWRILVVLHAAAHGPQAHKSQVEQKHVDAAIEIADWFGKQQLCLLQAMRDAADRETLDRLMEIVSRSYAGRATLRDLERRNCYKRPELERLASKFPCQIVIVREAAGEKGGRPKEVLQVLQVLA